MSALQASIQTEIRAIELEMGWSVNAKYEALHRVLWQLCKYQKPASPYAFLNEPGLNGLNDSEFDPAIWPLAITFVTDHQIPSLQANYVNGVPGTKAKLTDGNPVSGELQLGRRLQSPDPELGWLSLIAVRRHTFVLSAFDIGQSLVEGTGRLFLDLDKDYIATNANRLVPDSPSDHLQDRRRHLFVVKESH